MNIENNTNHRMPKKFIQDIMDELGVNPKIIVNYSHCIENNEISNERTNKRFDANGKPYLVAGEASETNEIYIYLGKWEEGKYLRSTSENIKWVLAHELRHQYHFYNYGLINYKFKDVEPEKVYRREENDCTRYANKKLGKKWKELKRYINEK